MARGPDGYDEYHRNQQLAVRGLASDIGTGTAATSAVTINDLVGIITTEDLTTAQNAVETITLTNDKVAVGDIVLASIGNGTNTQGTATVTSVSVAASEVVFKISNLHASAEALNGTLRISFAVIKALA